MQDAAHILVIDDELPIRTTMSALLQRRGYRVTTAASGEEALQLIHERAFDLLLLDLKMPGLGGIDVAERVRTRQPDTAIIILTGHGNLDSALQSMHLGVVDYVLKTTSPHDVLQRITEALDTQAEQRRQRQLLRTLHTVVAELDGEPVAAADAAPSGESWLRIGDLQISTWNQTVRFGDQPVPLTPTEFRVLVCLAQRAGHAVSAQELVQYAQGYTVESYTATELVKPHIYHLRQKLERDPAKPQLVLTVRGSGYLLAEQIVA